MKFKFSYHWVLFFLLLSSSSFAGVFEISAQGNYKKTNFDATHSAASESGTAGIAYYFWDLSALEASFTRGDANQVQPEYTAYQTFVAYGLDLLITMANRESSVKPYLKVGAAYQIKNLQYLIPNFAPITTIHEEGVAPTAGMGFKLMIGPQFGIKAGIDVSSSPLSVVPVTYDFGANAGVSLLF